MTCDSSGLTVDNNSREIFIFSDEHGAAYQVSVWGLSLCIISSTMLPSVHEIVESKAGGFDLSYLSFVASW